MDFIRRLFKKDQQVRPARQSGPRPIDWKMTTSELMADMKAGNRKQISGQELEWARDYERSLIPDNARFPEKGDVYESLKDQTVEYITEWAGPFSGGGEAMLFKGEQIWINSEQKDKKPVGAFALPVEYKKVEQRVVSEKERQSPKFGRLCFYFSTIELNERFRLVKTGYRKWFTF